MLRFLSRLLLTAVVSTSFPCFSSASQGYQRTTSCRYIRTDACWPTVQEWEGLNTTVRGRLVATIALGSPCHDPTYDAVECALLKLGWASPETHFNSPSSFLAPYFQNQSCDPFTPEATQCTLGNYVDYAINVTDSQDVAAGLRFAQAKNIRLVIKSTGHDWLGKSTGKGALGVWTHNLKSIDFLHYKSRYYTGSAVKMGAGVQSFEAYYAADSRGLRVLGGTCPTLSPAGGYTQGAGHGMLSSTYGLSADNTLEWEVVTAEGRLVTASPTEHSDLYWALSGGGPGTYGVVISLTVKAFQDGVIGGASLAFASTGLSQDAFWDGVGLWHASLSAIVDNGGTASYLLNNDTFSIPVLTFPGLSEDEVRTRLQPFTNGLNQRNITYTLNTTSFPTYVKHFDNYIGLPYGNDPSNQVTGSRLIHRSVVQNNNAYLTTTFRNISRDSRFTIIGVGLNVASTIANIEPASNSVLPAWRDTLIHVIVSGAWNFTAPFEDNVDVENTLTKSMVPMLEAAAPRSGAYMNEANFQQSDWQQNFYGSNYARLRAIKRAYDPTDLFYATTAVGSEAWTVESDGRLCRSMSW